MYFALNAGKTSMSKRAQCGQETEAYSIMVTLAAGLPMDMSPALTASDPAFWQAPRARVRVRHRPARAATDLPMREGILHLRRDTRQKRLGRALILTLFVTRTPPVAQVRRLSGGRA